MNVTELTRLTAERAQLEKEIKLADVAIANLRTLKYDKLAEDATLGLNDLKHKLAGVNGSLATLNRLSNAPTNKDTTVRPPRGRALNSETAFAYMEANPDGKAIVAHEFWEQVEKQPRRPEHVGCWNVLFPVERTRKGTLKKQAYIHWFRKKLGAVRLAWYLMGHPIADDENLYNECGNDLCVNPAHHYQGATGKIRKRRDHLDAPEVIETSFDEMQEYTRQAFSYIAGKWDRNKGVHFKDMVERLVPDTIPDEETLRKCLRTQKAQKLCHFQDGRWYALGYPQETVVSGPDGALPFRAIGHGG